VPLRGRTGVIGALSLVRGARTAPYGQTDLTLAEALGQHAGLAVENARLYVAAQEAVAARDDFLAILSPELRNPLAPLRNSLHLLARADPATGQWRRAQEIAQRQIAHLTRLVDELLDVTRIAHKKIRLHRVELEVAELVRRAAEDYRALVEGRGVRLAVEAPREAIFVYADATRLVQVLGNLLQNAAKFTRAGDTVTVALVRAGAMAEIHVRDTGAGIDPSLLKGVFEPFTQAKQTLARTDGGLGLGLAFVKELVELHGGTVTATSEGQGCGAEFVIRLPLVERASRRARDGAGAAAAAPAQRRRVLVVDDNRDAAETLAELLRMLGHDVEIAFDGAAAIEQALRTAPEVVLCDIGLPGMSGYEVATALRKQAAGTRLIALSGYARPEDVRRSIEAGFDAHLGKPADLEEVEQVLR
jgi:signal transduction histidine kinase/CheY-like chemotaxis protein